MIQQFNTVDLVRLEVQNDWPDLPNLVENPRGGGGAWGWSDTPSGRMSGHETFLRLSMDAFEDFYSVGGYYEIPIDKVTTVGSMQVRGAVTRVAFSTAVSLVSGPGMVFSFMDDNGFLPGSPSVSLATNGVKSIPATNIPVGTVKIRVSLSYELNADDPTARLDVTDVILMVGTPSEIAASDPLTEPPWTNVLGSSHTIDTQRDELDQGTLTATIYDSTLDPATNTLIRPGKRCRLQALVDGVWENLFTGKLDNPSTIYNVKDPSLPDGKRTEIKLLAHDAASALVNERRANGVATIPELPAVLLGAGVPWNINGSTATIDPDTAVVVAVNESASALDQVAITRDSVLGYAWIDRDGTLQAWDADLIPTTVAASLSETDYSDLNLDFDLGRCINSVKVRLTRINPGSGDTEEIELGPYENAASMREWGPRRAEFRVQGFAESLVDDYAAAILAANSTPAKRINWVELPLRTVAEVEAKALLDLYDLVESSNTRGAVVDQAARVTSVRHVITADVNLGGKWLMTVGFSTDGSVAVPQVTPSPTAGGSQTLAELLRPIGEVTMWYGAKADIPAGWLPCDGTLFSSATYPKLATRLGGTTLPNFTDRFPIGAGTKALGTVGGTSTKTLAVANLPAHDHPQRIVNGTLGGSGYVGHNAALANWSASAGSANYPTGQTGSGTAFDVMNPWRALWFIIRAA